jgi:glycine dehydrogenase subunit 1
MTYIPLTDAQHKAMLNALGVGAIDALLGDIPRQVRLQKPLAIPGPLSEFALTTHVSALAGKNATVRTLNSFLGAGCYDHFVPAAVGHIIGRSEFYTAYTPYQPEASQGTLQAIYEYQSFMCMLTDMDVSNASLYDGQRHWRKQCLWRIASIIKRGVLVARTIHPEYREVLRTYTRHVGLEIIELPVAPGGFLTEAQLAPLLDEHTCCVALQNPNFFGVIEKGLSSIGKKAHEHNALLITVVNPIASAVMSSGARVGADIVVGDGQALGNGLNFGGPSFGFITAKNEFVRKMPGRIVGKTRDKEGNGGYVLTLQTREQHIRRQRATSNICSNQALNALACAVYLSLLGPEGLRQVAQTSVDHAHYCFHELKKNKKIAMVFDAPFFNEFMVKVPCCAKTLCRKLLKKGIVAGHLPEKAYPEFKDCLLIAVTETKTKKEIDDFVKRIADELGA